MSTRTYKTFAFSAPPAMIEKIERKARERQMTKSEIMREMFRVWEKNDPDSDENILRLAREVRAEEAINPTPREKLLKDFQEISLYLQQKARERGITVTEDGEIIEAKEV